MAYPWTKLCLSSAYLPSGNPSTLSAIALNLTMCPAMLLSLAHISVFTFTFMVLFFFQNATTVACSRRLACTLFSDAACSR